MNQIMIRILPTTTTTPSTRTNHIRLLAKKWIQQQQRIEITIILVSIFIICYCSSIIIVHSFQVIPLPTKTIPPTKVTRTIRARRKHVVQSFLFHNAYNNHNIFRHNIIVLQTTTSSSSATTSSTDSVNESSMTNKKYNNNNSFIDNSTTTTTTTTKTTTKATTTTEETEFEKETKVAADYTIPVYSTDAIQTVTVVGGTHGNEYTGVWIVQELNEAIKKYNTEYNNSSTNNKNIIRNTATSKTFVDVLETPTATTTTTIQPPYDKQIQINNYTTFNISTIIGNPLAVQQNKRFIDIDLNRQFSFDTLQSTDNTCTTDINKNNDYYEIQRAKELNLVLGPKTYQPIHNSTVEQQQEGSNDNIDLIVDLHSTTANMDVTIIIPEGDIVMIHAAAYVMYKCNQYYSKNTTTATTTSTSTGTRFDTRIMIDHVQACHSTRPFLPSIGKHEFTIEVGPVPQGVVRHDAIIKTRTALQYLFEFIELYNTYKNKQQQQQSLNNTTNTLTSLSSSVPIEIQSLVQSMYVSTNGLVSCYTDLGKLSWEVHPEYSNFPYWIIHESIQDNDFIKQITINDPLFVSLNGTIIYYNGQYGPTVYIAFINEGGYYYSTSGTGIVMLNKQYVQLNTGTLCL